MKMNFLQRHPLLGSLLLGVVYVAPVSAIPLEPGMQIVPDPQLQACLDQAVDANNWATTEDVTALDCPGYGIQTLDGIGQLNNLTQLNLSGNQISKTYELELLSQLTLLNLSSNRLVDIAPLLNLHNLQQLNLGGNFQLKSWDVETVIQNNPGLTHLGVADIHFDNLTHSWLPPMGPQGEYNLVELDISRTGQYLDLYPVSQYPNLKALKAAEIQLLETGPLDQLQQLEVLDLSNNRLRYLNGLQQLHGLKQLNLGGNSLLQAAEVQMLIQNNPGLTHLGVADITLGNDLNWLPPTGPQGEYELLELDISHTGQYVDLLPLTQYPNLRVLKAADNRIEFTGPLDQLQKLEVIDLNNNNLSDLYSLQTLHNIQQLNLSGNSRLQMTEIQMLLQNNPGLSHLSLADIELGGDLTWLPPAGSQGEYDLVELDISRTGFYPGLFSIMQYPHLRVLKAAGNQTEYTGPLDQLQQLEVLDLSNNNLAHPYDLQSLYSLRQLNIGGNMRLQATDVQLLIQNIPGLTHLGVADIALGNDLNWLPPVGPQGEYDFIELDISRTGQYFDLNRLTQYPNLKVLKAAGNQIQYAGPLDQFLQLETLDLSDNKLNDLNGLQAFYNLLSLNLNGNSNLQLPELQSLIQNNPGLTHLEIADIPLGNDLNWLPPVGPQGEYDLVELNISRTGQYVDLYPVTQYANLKVLKASGNQIQYTGPLNQFQQLQVLDLGNNSLSDLSGLVNVKTLHQLNLSGNNQLQASEVLLLIQNNIALTHLGVADIAFGNDLNWLPAAGPQGEFDLVELDISRTGQYLDLYPVTQYSNLRVLNAAGNQIQYTVPLDQLQKLQVLDLSNNQLTDLYGLQALHNLRQLNLSGNSNLPEIDVQSVIFNNPGLTHLAIADIAMGGDLMWLPMSYESRSGLIELDISRTAQFVDLSPITQYENLRTLKAAGLQLRYLGPIDQLQKLEILDLRDNALEHVDMLDAIATLTHLDLRGNDLIPCNELDYLETSLIGVDFYRPVSCVYLNPPMITLLTPIDGGQFFTTDQVHLSAYANDVEDGDLSSAIEWSSNLDGMIGIGRELDVSFSAGQHQLTATITDSHGNRTSSQIVNLAILPNNPPALSLLQPQNGLIVNAGTPVLLTAEASDPEEGDMTPLIKWTSSLDGELGIGGAIQMPLSEGQHGITASVTDAAGVTVEQTVTISVNALPELTLQTPLNGTIYQQGDTVTMNANANDLEDGDLSAQIVWTSNLDGNLGSGSQLNLNLSSGTHLITATITDSTGASVNQSVTVTINSAPQITLQSPANGDTFMLQEAIALNASALDPESGDISANIEWSSDIDGNLGTGASLINSLSLGTHTLTATINDGDGGVTSVSTQVTVQQVELAVTVSGKGKRRTADLVWSKSRTSVDIYMDNSVVAVAPASGSLQLTFKDSAVFRVCETGTNYCSLDVLAQ